MLKHMFKSLIVLLLPLFTSLLSRLLYLFKEDVNATFNNLYTIVNIPEDLTCQLRLYHPLFRDLFFSKD
jgi:hypothetical protein